MWLVGPTVGSWAPSSYITRGPCGGTELFVPSVTAVVSGAPGAGCRSSAYQGPEKLSPPRKKLVGALRPGSVSCVTWLTALKPV